jgi:hypothetical protein
MVRAFALVVLLAVASAASADDPPLVKVYMAGKDTVIIMPKGMEHLPEPSKYLGTKPTIVIEKLTDGSQKLILRDRTPKVSQVGGAKLTIRVGGTPVTPTVFVGIPEGAKYEAPKADPPKETMPKK